VSRLRIIKYNTIVLPVPAGLGRLSETEAAHVLAKVGPSRWVLRDPFASLREALHLLLDPMAVMLAIAAAIYFALGETRDAVVLVLAIVTPLAGLPLLLLPIHLVWLELIVHPVSALVFHMFRVMKPTTTEITAAALIGVIAVAWRLVPFATGDQ
jgi:hypothetical protein